jgi:hypothetical protein
MLSRAGSAVKKGAGDALKKGGVIERNQGLIGGAARGVGSVLAAQQEQGVARDRIDVERERFDLERERFDDEQERRRRTAELLMPLFFVMSHSTMCPFLRPTSRNFEKSTLLGTPSNRIEVIGSICWGLKM